MTFLTRNMDRSTIVFFAVTALACVTKIAATAITTSLATTALMPGRIFGLAITASAFEIFAVFTLFATVGLFLARVSRALLFTAWIPGALSCLAGTILSLITLALTIHFADEKMLKEESDSSVGTRGIAAAGLAIGIVGLIPQTAFYVLVWPAAEQGFAQPSEILEERPSPPRSLIRRSISVHMASLGPSSPKFFRSHSEPGSPSLAASSPRSSFRDSASQALRPMTSKTRLLLHTSFASRDPKSISSEPMVEVMRQNDDFENWDTSGVDDGYAGPFGSKTKMTRLETIPGSRPVSPAHPLNGPFPDEEDIAPDQLPPPDQLPLPESPLQSPISPMSPNSETSSLRSMRRPTIRRNNSNSNDQSFIHPLFRTESPAPPPLTSPGTVIHASPYAGQIVNPDSMALTPRLHSSHGSRPTTPNLISPARSRPGSLRSFRLNSASSPVEGNGSVVERGPSALSEAATVPND
ncbi:hypothetical protein PRZ48_003953 [Zasmidium cellare]|uniref:Uncharacterized protein n=1 Tax=Zasmidium cellare TaxID=395010 RepID=A0ABR0EYQ3_ZASCE|nr:hypothetical protein PRZ48_003953 [Zasmidium cellare]